MKHINVKKEITHKVRFMDDEVEVKELSVDKIEEMQAGLSDKDDSLGNFNSIVKVLNIAVVNAEDLDEEYIKQFPLKQLTELVEEILVINGLVARDEGND